MRIGENLDDDMQCLTALALHKKIQNAYYLMTKYWTYRLFYFGNW